jgi:hypothetical protein
VLTHKEALELILKRIDYNAGHCGSMEAISNLVPHWVLRLANESLEEPTSDVEQDELDDEVPYHPNESQE